MAKPRKSQSKQSGSDESQPFEHALAELQGIVDELEGGALGLAESMRRFERGVALLRDCYRTLEEAEQKIEILTGFDAEGKPQVEAFDSTATSESSQSAAKRRTGRRKKSAESSDDGDLDDEALF